MPNLLQHPDTSAARAERLRRRGRLLVELLLAMVLLVIGATASVTLVRANVALTERVTFLASSRAATREVGEALHVAPCATAAGSAQDGLTEIAWIPSVSGRLVALSLDAWRAPHPSGLTAPRPLSAQLAGWCP
jgi:Tfp pilus assembly protein PilV